jgi:hypothetical protein
MAAGNNALYVTSQGCSVSGLSIGCPVTATDGWYYNGNSGYSYYISGGSVTSIDYAPCSTPAPPPPTPAPFVWQSIYVGKRGASASGACSFAYDARDLLYYIDTDSLDTANSMRTTSDGSSNPANGYYSDGTNWVNVSSGNVISRGTCNF